MILSSQFIARTAKKSVLYLYLYNILESFARFGDRVSPLLGELQLSMYGFEVASELLASKDRTEVSLHFEQALAGGAAGAPPLRAVVATAAAAAAAVSPAMTTVRTAAALLGGT